MAVGFTMAIVFFCYCTKLNHYRRNTDIEISGVS